MTETATTKTNDVLRQSDSDMMPSAGDVLVPVAAKLGTTD